MSNIFFLSLLVLDSHLAVQINGIVANAARDGDLFLKMIGKLESWSRLQRDARYAEISSSGAYSPNTIQFMHEVAVQRAIDDDEFDFDSASQWAGYMDWGTHHHQRVVQTTTRLHVEHRVKSMVCRCVFLQCDTAAVVGMIPGAFYPWATIYRSDIEDGFDSSGGCFNDLWNLEATAQWSSKERETDAGIRKVLLYTIVAVESTGASVVSDATGSTAETNATLGGYTAPQNITSIAEHDEVVNRFHARNVPCGASRWFALKNKPDSVHLSSSMELNNKDASRVLISENSTVKLNAAQSITLSRRDIDADATMQTQGVTLAANLESSLLRDTAVDLELIFGESATVADVVTSAVASVGLGVGSKFVFIHFIRKLRWIGLMAGFNWGIVLLASIILAILDQVALLTLLVSEIIFMRQTINRVGLFTAHAERARGIHSNSLESGLSFSMLNHYLITLEHSP